MEYTEREGKKGAVKERISMKKGAEKKMTATKTKEEGGVAVSSSLLSRRIEVTVDL